MPDADGLRRAARRVRATCVDLARRTRSGHLSSSLTCADLLVALYHGWLRHDPARPEDPERDRCLLSKGHGSAALYAVLVDRGFLPAAVLSEFHREGGCLPQHPCRHALPLLECSAGSLGHGLGVATGMARALADRSSAARVAVILGDGECNEGSCWEAAMTAAAQRLGNLVVLVDANGVQAVGQHDELTAGMPLAGKFAAFGWTAQTLADSDPMTILAALPGVSAPDRPTALIVPTRTGVSFMDGDVLWHYRVPGAAEHAAALAELGERSLVVDGDA